KAAGDDAEIIGSETHDGEVGFDAAMLVEKVGVGDATNRRVHLIDCHHLDEIARARALNIKDGKGGEVHHADAFAHGKVFGVDDRRPPAPIPFSGAVENAVAE